MAADAVFSNAPCPSHPVQTMVMGTAATATHPTPYHITAAYKRARFTGARLNTHTFDITTSRFANTPAQGGRRFLFYRRMATPSRCDMSALLMY